MAAVLTRKKLLRHLFVVGALGAGIAGAGEVGCSSSSGTGPGDNGSSDAGDAGKLRDSGDDAPTDATTPGDAGSATDTGTVLDASDAADGGNTADGGGSVDAGGLFDAANPYDASLPGNCGKWADFSGDTTAVVGESVRLTVTATGVDLDNLGYTWTQSPSADGGGLFGILGASQDEAAGPSDVNTFLCTAPGTTTVTVTVDEGPAAADAGACPASATTVSTTIVCSAYPANQVESAWVELGVGGSAIARALTAAATCPSITLNGGAPQPMALRIAAGMEPLRATTSTTLGPQYSKPSAFPVSTCELALPSGTTSAVVAGRTLALPKANPTTLIVLGDTGCRMKAAIPASGSQFQGCNDPTQYPFQQLATLAASFHPDVVLHVGDYQYRENECPPNQANCAGSPWGYGWDTWEADFFRPAADLLAAAPWIVTRGNHEQCTRAGQGWYRFLDPGAYSEAHSCNAAANDAVLQSNGVLVGGAYNDPYAVPIGSSSQIIVFDSNNVGAAAVTSGGSSNFLTYQAELEAAGAFATSHSVYNIWSNHHPLLGFAPVAGAAPAPGNLDLLSVMAATYPTTYFPPNINLALHGHTHLFEAIDFTSTNYPATVLAGNAGTLLDVALPDPFPSTTVHPDPAGSATVSTIANSAGFGFLLMQYTGAVWTITEYRLDGTVRSVCTAQLNGQMTCTVNGYIP